MNTAATSPAVRTACQVPGRVLVAGATGLLGSKVTAELLAAMPRLRGREPVVTRAGLASCSKVTASTSCPSGPSVNSA